MNKQIAREYVGGGLVVTVELEDETYYVLVNHPDHEHPITRYSSPRERPALRVFGESVSELSAQFEAQGWRWNR
ncbi:hypothetical protein [Arthrobacter sp. UYCo732]|uniref:hypothetical protein n=1 Tax=Arthrobacter sp. UYCo732 TaxID=3156336 RepID=UPI003397F046